MNQRKFSIAGAANPAVDVRGFLEHLREDMINRGAVDAVAIPASGVVLDVSIRRTDNGKFDVDLPGIALRNCNPVSDGLDAAGISVRCDVGIGSAHILYDMMKSAIIGYSTHSVYWEAPTDGGMHPGLMRVADDVTDACIAARKRMSEHDDS